MNNPVIVGIGEILFDLLPQGPQLGGAPANFAYHVSRLGAEGYAVSAIGKDELGERVKSILTDKQLNAIIPEIDKPTGVVEVTLDARGVPSYNIIQDVAWDNVPYTDEMKALAARTTAVCFGTLAQRNVVTRNTIISFLKDTPADCLKVYDINLRQHYYSKELIEESLKISDILKINEEEIKTVSALLGLGDDPLTACRKLIEIFDLQMVIHTRGGAGSDVITPDAILSAEAPDVPVVDTVGAGDAFTAAFVYAYLRGDSIAACHQLANEISTFVCTKSGAMPDYDNK